jgi:hypothetical protein
MKKAAKAIEPLPIRAARVLAKLKHVRGLSEAEKSVHALGLAATPQERWELLEKRVRALGYWKPPNKRGKGQTGTKK